MNTIVSLNSTAYYDKMEITHIVYEKGDDGLLIACKVENNNKLFYTNFSISFSQFNQIISKLMQKGIDIYEAVNKKLFQSSAIISELDLSKVYGSSVVLNEFSLLQNVA